MMSLNIIFPTPNEINRLTNMYNQELSLFAFAER